MCNNSNRCCFKIFFVRKSNERINVFSSKSNCHAFLTFGNSKFSAIETIVFFRHLVKVYLQAIGKFANCNRNTTCAKIVAAFNHATRIAPAKQTLNLALNRCISFLNFRTTGFKRAGIVRFRRPRCATYAIAPRAPAQQNNHIARNRSFAANMIGGRSTHHSTNFHVLCSIAWMIKFAYLPCCQSNLIPIARIARSSSRCKLTLRQLARNSLRHRAKRVRTPRYAHGLIHIATPRKRIANSAAYTGCCAAERLNFGRMIMRFVLEQIQPILIFPINITGNLYRASINLFRFI